MKWTPQSFEMIKSVKIPLGTIIYEPREHLDHAIVGFKNGSVLYEYSLLIHAFIKTGMDYEEAKDWISYNIIGLEGNMGYPKVVYDESYEDASYEDE